MGEALGDAAFRESADWWFKVAFTQGLAVAFVTGVLGLLLWVTIILINILKKWIPLKFQSSIERDKEVIKSLKDISEGMICVHDRVHNIEYAGRHIATGLAKIAVSNKERLGITSDVLFHFDEAQKVLSAAVQPSSQQE